MKKSTWIILLLLVLFAGDRLLGWVLQQQLNKSQFRYSRLYKGTAAADILIVGNSRGLNVYLPAVEALTGKKAVSLCYNGMPGDLAAALAKDYIDKYPALKTIVIELCMAEMPDEKLLPGFVSYMDASPRIDSLIHNKAATAWYGARVSHLFRYNTEVFQRALYYRNRLDNDWTSDRTMPERVMNEVANYKMNFIANPAELQHIKAITDYCRNRDIEVKLLIAPFFPGFTVSNVAGLKAETEKLTGFRVHDYSTALANKNGFSDYLHLNITGCQEFIQLLGKDGFLRAKSND